MTKSNKLTIVTLALLFLVSSIVVLFAPNTYALSGSDFKSGRIIDDAIFYNKNSMTPQQIQQFLNAKVPTCDRNRASTNPSYQPPWTCLFEYQENPTTRENNVGRPTYQVPGGKSAAQIIWDVGQQYGLNPQVLIVMLQKEQSLITDNWPWKIQYDRAMGYACPDSGPGYTANCDSNYYGFYNQVDAAAWQLKRYIQFPDNYNFKAGVTRYIQYSPDPSCGGSNVFIENAATAALYNYTPYQPNAGALANLYGTAPCGAYGNRNFWRIFNEWFGSTKMPELVKARSSSAVYLVTNGYKFYAPSESILHDYGFDPTKVSILEQSYLDLIPFGSTNSSLSSSLGHIIKTGSDTDGDGGTVYIVTVGKKYSIGSMEQFNRFGYIESSIKYLPEVYVASIPSGGPVRDYIYTPSSNVFKIDNGNKRIYFDNKTHLEDNPSGIATFFSDAAAQLTYSGYPVSNREVLLSNTNGAVRLYVNNNLYSIPSMDVFRCWGFGISQETPLYKLAKNSYVTQVTHPTALNCNPVLISLKTYLLDGKERISTNLFTATQALNTDLTQVISKLPTRQSELKSAYKESGSKTVFIIESGKRRPIASSLDMDYLGIKESQIDKLSYAKVDIPSGSVKLAPGRTVKTPNSSTIYLIDNNNQKSIISSAEDFESKKLDWGQILTVNKSTLDPAYPTSQISVQQYMLDKNNQVFLFDKNGCYHIFDNLLYNYGLDKSLLGSQQITEFNLYKNIDLRSCKPGSVYIKASNSSSVYKIDNGNLIPYSSWGQLVSESQTTNPNVQTISPLNLSRL